ncbi:DUF1905 domain-containing protein [Gemmatimonas phototrophica]|uniref:DUF1905 domain-containing protein n=1 Tax=Gemmatimonas phototrophica TaxID=1379270 RepID=A0A143BGH3_9BACT|nr:DUF1905 domain-containing protein [Gemmatimonas phototrophica]AMW03693.1 hypothetical protein GEMMAAP_00210 [Gemmatimonas phototrophica]
MARSRFSATNAVGHSFSGTFTATLFRYPGKGGWTFVEVPDELAPPVTHGWGRTPVTASMGGVSWETSVWRGKDGRTLLALPKKVRGSLGEGDHVTCRIQFSAL